MPAVTFALKTTDDLLSLGVALQVFKPARRLSAMRLPLFAGKVSAGFPSPAADYVDKSLDLNELLIQKPAATFFVRAQGESMLGAGIHPNDILVIDRSIDPVAGKVVICAINGELTVKRLEREHDRWTLKAENPAYPDIPLTDDLELVVWGVVANSCPVSIERRILCAALT
jgi:DNA polymerase V